MRWLGIAVLAVVFSARAALAHDLYDELGHAMPHDHDGEAGPSAPAAAQNAPGVETHDGFYLRFHSGFGYTEAKTDFLGIDVKVAGGSSIFHFELGGAVMENLIVFGVLAGDVIQQPTLTVGDLEFTADDEVTAGLFGFGAGVAYYFMPMNLFVSGALTTSQLQLQRNNEAVAETDFGPGFTLSAGKEWWVSDNWALGVAGALTGARVPEKDAKDVVWAATSFSIAFSATYN